MDNLPLPDLTLQAAARLGAAALRQKSAMFRLAEHRYAKGHRDQDTRRGHYNYQRLQVAAAMLTVVAEQTPDK